MELIDYINTVYITSVYYSGIYFLNSLPADPKITYKYKLVQKRPNVCF